LIYFNNFSKAINKNKNITKPKEVNNNIIQDILKTKIKKIVL